MIADCLLTNTTIPTTVHKNNINDYCEKMIESIVTQTIAVGLQRVEQKAVDQPAVINDIHMVDSSEKLSNDDEISSTTLWNSLIKIPLISTESIPIASIRDLCCVFTKV